MYSIQLCTMYRFTITLHMLALQAVDIEVNNMKKLVFNKEGAVVKEAREKSLSEGTEWIITEKYNWEELLKKKDIEIKVTGIDYKLTNNGDISELELTTEYIKRTWSQKTTGEFWEKVKRELGIEKNENGEILLNPNESGKDNLADFVKFLYENEYFSEANIPISSGYKRYLLNKEPKDKKGNEMVQPVKIAENVFLETHKSLATIKKEIKKLGEKFGEKGSRDAS